MNMQNLLGAMGGAGFGRNRGQAAPNPDDPKPDTAQQIHISSLALLKMLKHCKSYFKIARAGVPMEVMGLMLGEFIDEYTIRVIDVFAMPQSGTGVSVEAVDPVFQQKMTELLKQTGRGEVVVGWYHSHPGFGCWLSSVDCNTQQSFEMLQERAVAVVVDPIQSVKGKVVIDAFRLIQPTTAMMGIEPRQTTSNIGHIKKPSIAALVHGLNRAYYGIAIAYRQNDFEQKMLLNLHKQKWSWGLELTNFQDRRKKNESTLKELVDLTDKYQKWIEEETEKSKEEFVVSTVGKLNPKTHLEDTVEEALIQNVSQCLGTMLNTVVF